MKPKIKNAEDLDRVIAELEQRAAGQKKEIQETFKVVSENLKPMNLVKSGFRSVFSRDNKADLVNILLGLGSGFLSRKLFIGKSTGMVGKTVGKAVQWGMAGLVSQNAEKIKHKAGEWIDKIFRRRVAGSNHAPVSVSSPERKQIT